MDVIKLEPKKEDLRVEGILGKFDVVGTVYIITKEFYIKDSPTGNKCEDRGT